MSDMIKKAGLESSGSSDPRTKLPVRISTTVRIKYRKYFNDFWSDRRDHLSDLSNAQLNEIIGQDFAASHDSVVHMFLAKSSNIASQKREWIEIRKVKTRRAFNFFFSIIRPDGIDIIGTSTRYFKPIKPKVFLPR